MNILITGAGGFIGSHLCNYLNNKHKLYRIYSLSKPTSDYDCYNLDLTDLKAVKDKINIFSSKKIEVIIHLASKMASPDQIDNIEIFNDNIRIAESMVFLVKKIEPEILINFSSMALYPNISGIFSENSNPNPKYNNDCLYGMSKYAAEVFFDFLLRDENVQTAHLRIAQVYGGGMREDRIIRAMQNELEQKNTITVFGNGERESCFIEINKLVNYVEYFIEHKISGTYNIGDENISYFDLAKRILQQNGNKESIINKNPRGNKAKFNLDFTKIQKLLETLRYQGN